MVQDGAALMAGGFRRWPTSSPVTRPPGGGVKPKVIDLDGDRKADLVAVPAGEGRAIAYLGKDLAPDGTPPGLELGVFNGAVEVG